MARILADTSAVYALIDREDHHHRKAVAILRSFPRKGLMPLLSNFIVAETHALLLSHLGAETARRWLLTQVWPIEPVTLDDEQRAREIIRKFTDKTFSYTDATSFAVMERLAIKAVFGFDPHFEQYGFRCVS